MSMKRYARYRPSLHPLAVVRGNGHFFMSGGAMSRLQARDISNAKDVRRSVEERGLSHVKVGMRDLFVAAVEGRI